MGLRDGVGLVEGLVAAQEVAITVRCERLVERRYRGLWPGLAMLLRRVSRMFCLNLWIDCSRISSNDRRHWPSGSFMHVCLQFISPYAREGGVFRCALAPSPGLLLIIAEQLYFCKWHSPRASSLLQPALRMLHGMWLCNCDSPSIHRRPIHLFASLFTHAHTQNFTTLPYLLARLLSTIRTISFIHVVTSILFMLGFHRSFESYSFNKKRRFDFIFVRYIFWTIFLREN